LEVTGKLHLEKEEYQIAFMKFHSCFEIRRKIFKNPDHIDLVRIGLLICSLYETLQEVIQSKEVFSKQKEMYENLANQIRRSKIYSEILEEVGLIKENKPPRFDTQVQDLSLLQNTNRELNLETYSLNGFHDKGKGTESDAYNGQTQASSRDGTQRTHRHLRDEPQKSSREKYRSQANYFPILSNKSLDSLREDYEEESGELEKKTPRKVEKESPVGVVSPEKKADRFYLFWKDRPYLPLNEMKGTSNKSIKPSNFARAKSTETQKKKFSPENY